MLRTAELRAAGISDLWPLAAGVSYTGNEAGPRPTAAVVRAGRVSLAFGLDVGVT